MEHGYQMLRHVVAQVFGNFGQAARLTLLLTFLPMALLLVLFLQTGVPYNSFPGGRMEPAMAPGSNGGLLFLAVLAGIVVSAITYCWAAVGWHRFVLLEEHGNGIVPQWRGPNILSYIGRAILIGVVVMLIGIVSGMLLTMIMFAAPVQAVGFVLATGWVMGMSWVITRMGLILPAAALGKPMTIRESWTATKPVATDLLVPLFVIAVAMNLLSELIMLLFTNSTLGMIPLAFLYWMQVLLNLSLMTTLYGTQVEGRPLT
ncbi:MAG: hypothetical protein COW55_11130 [Rhodobacteraceae bacterium CG17_big_fil_post_rev_8_21_14_2_50_65_11]|nr:MAG: hypothetical protein COW55_11130 [Rhodobacteraceae bacterium CG17_big_fil_post_rev_8_21_14_2_50_65_11]